MKYTLKVYNICEFGTRTDADGNPHQEDSTYPLQGHFNDSDRTFVLCDGMGGHDAGEVASATVCEAIGSYIISDGHDAEGVFTIGDFNGALNAAFDALDKKDSGAAKKMGTTMTFLKLHSQGVTIAHIGDSRVYHIRPGKTGQDTRILFETSDHSLVNDLIKVGELTREEARNSKQKNVITRAMQPQMPSRPKADIYTTADIKPGDFFYMCSDGMLEQDDMEDGTTLRNIFSAQGGSDENRVNILRSVTDDNRDNHTAIILHIINVEGAAPVSKPQRMGMVNDSDDVTPVSSATPQGKKKGKSAIVAFIVVAICVVGLILFLKQCGGDNKDAVNEAQIEQAAPTTPDAKQSKPSDDRQDKSTPSHGDAGASKPEQNMPAATPSEAVNASSVGTLAPKPTADRAGNMQDQVDALNKLKKPTSSVAIEEGVVESDESKAQKVANNQNKK